MTRINVVDVALLTDQHLFAEYREITRVFALVKQACEKYPIEVVLGKVVPTYRLNAGHVVFFYDKLAFIERRYFELKQEAVRRGINITPKDDIINFRHNLDARFYQDFVPTGADTMINVERLIEKIEAKPNWYKHNGTIICDKTYRQKLLALCQA